MAIGVYFNPPSLSAKQYDDTIKRLEAAGAGSPQGRVSHVCFGQEGRLQVFDVWDSEAAFDEFGQTLMPILQEMGLGDVVPVIEPVHNTIPGS